MSNRLAQIKNVYDTANPNVNKGTKAEETVTKAIPDSERAGNRATYLYNKVLEGVGSTLSGLGDLAVQGASVMNTGVLDASPVTRKLYRENIAPSIRTYLKDTVGAKTDKGLEARYNNETITSALGGVFNSAPAMLTTAASGGVGTMAMFAQSFDNAIESINQSEEGRNLDEATKSFFAGGVGIATALLEKYSFDKIFKGETGLIGNAIAKRALRNASEETGGKVTGDVFSKFLDKEIIDLTNKYVKGGARLLDASLVEYATEASQEAVQAGAELLVNKETGKPVFDTSETSRWDGFLNRINKAGVAGAIGGLFMGGLSMGISNLAGVKPSVVEESQSRLDDINNTLENENVSDAAKEVLVQEKIKIQDEAQKIADKVDEAYSKLDDKQKERVNEIVEEKAKLKEVLSDENVPDSIKQILEEQSKSLDAELSQIKPVKYTNSVEPIQDTTDTKEVVKQPKLVETLNGEGEYFKDGEKGIIKQDGQSLVFETKDRIYELGNIDEVSDSTINQFGIKKEAGLNINVGEDGTIDIDGKKYRNTNEVQEDAFNYDVDGNVQSITLENSKRQKRTIRGARAEEIAYQYKLKSFENNATEEQISRAIEQANEAIRVEGETKPIKSKEKIRVIEQPREKVKENINKQDKALSKELSEIKPVEEVKPSAELESTATQKESNNSSEKVYDTEEGKSIPFKIEDVEIKPYKTIDFNEEGRDNSFEIKIKDENIGHFVINNQGKYAVVESSEVKDGKNEANSQKGIGTQAYKLMADYLSKYGKTLRSDNSDMRSKEGTALWESLVKKGLAEKVIEGDNSYYVYKNKGEKSNEQNSVEKNAQKPKETTTEAGKESITGITQEATAKARESMGIEAYEKTSQSNEQRRAKAEKAIKEGYNVKQLIQNIKNSEDFVPSRQEMEILKIYENSLDAAINKNPTTEKIAERADLLRTVDIGTSRAGAALQAVAGVEASVDNLANFLQAEAIHYGVDELPQNIIDDLKGKYEKGQEAKRAYEEGYQKAKDELIKQQAEAELAKQRKKNKPSVKKSSADYASERADLKQSIKDKLKKARGQLNAVPVPYLNELIAIAPDVAKLVRSYVEEGVSKLDDIVKRVHSDLKDDIDGITEQDVIDLISGQYNPKRPTKTEILSQVRDLKEQAKLLKKIDDLENGKVPNDPVKQVRRNAELEALRKQIKELEDEVGVTEQRTLKSRRTALDNKIKQLKDDLEAGNFDLEPAEPRRVRLDAETQKKQDEYIAFLKETNRRRDQAVYEQQSKITKAWLKFQQVLGLRRLIQTSIDFSMPFRQAVTVTLNPRYARTTLESFGNMFKSTVSEKKYDRIMFAIQQDPLYNDMRADGLMFSEVDSKDNLKREEDYRTSFLYKIPYLREPFLASNRAAAGYINTARYNLYLKGVERLRAQGITHENSPENYAALAKWTMNMTGRGNLLDFMEKGENASKWQRIMGDTFYGTRLMASRFNMLNPNYYIKMPKEQRIEALKDIGSYVALSGVVALGAIGSGAKVSLDPEDADFLKAKWGDKRYDMFSGGMNTYLRTAYRLLKAIYQRTNPRLYGDNKDKVALKKANKYGSFAVKSGTDFFRYKLAPNTSYVLSGTLGKDPLGRDFDPKDILRFYPMYVDDLKDAMKKDDATLESLSILAPSLFGIGVQEYSNKKKPTKEKE